MSVSHSEIIAFLQQNNLSDGDANDACILGRDFPKYGNVIWVFNSKGITKLDLTLGGELKGSAQTLSAEKITNVEISYWQGGQNALSKVLAQSMGAGQYHIVISYGTGKTTIELDQKVIGYPEQAAEFQKIKNREGVIDG